MYRKDSTGWIKHVDFIILDLICLQVAFVLAYVLSGYGANPYQLILYRNMAVFMEVADLVVLFAMGTLKNVLKRGYYKDFVVTAQHDEDILKAIAGAADALYDIYRENQVPGRRRKLLKDMERIFDETHNADVANALAILEANEHTIYDPPAVFDSNKSEILLSTENKLKEIYEAFPNEGKVVLGYSYLVSWNYVTWLDFPRPIDEELIPLFKKWIRKFPENKLELMEYYSFILFEKWLYMDSLDNISEANKIYYEIKAIADELSKDYADNQVTQMLSMGIVRKL